MHGAVLVGTIATGGVLMQGVFLIDAELNGVNLKGAHLNGADLRDAKLLETRIVNAVFDGVDLKGADLTGAYLIGANLSRAINLDKARLTGACYDAEVSWPKGFYAKAAGAKPIHDDRDALLQKLYEAKTSWYVDTNGTLRTR